ncbi:hypothetical protein [Engelhardtia mirabilis]|uniref:Uncharacterized protein n=1 Tax=Engelhardtia mirabilis TaxID=2528011 RepID=A0A518BL61_9BACT|nr:hypothetical protein Pla133_27860 [Planctomycetes bacterium Pla133]QDV02024.1 hypothetical protein Pla86_27850 [Planctomycetes bacterium Pla86]
MRGALALILAAATLAGCIGVGSEVPTEPHRGNVANLVQFHDAGVEWEVDAELISEGEAAQWTAESGAMLSTFNALEMISPYLGATFLPVVARVERYAVEQPGLSEADRLERTTYATIYRNGFEPKQP